MISFESVSYTIAAVLFLSLALLLLGRWRGQLDRLLIFVATLVSALWAGLAAYESISAPPGSLLLHSLEIFRNIVWLIFLFQLIDSVYRNENKSLVKVSSVLTVGIGGLCLILLLILVLSLLNITGLPQVINFYVPAIGHAVLGLAGLMLVEQIFRHARPDQRNAIMFLCLGLGSLFAYDVLLYTDAVILAAIDTNLWDARGIVNSFAVFLISIPVLRNQDWTKEIYVSHSIVYQTTVLLVASLYLLIAIIGGYYISQYGADWGGVAQIIFLAAAAIVLFLLISSRQLRAHAKIFVGKHFFKYKYDYREEWQRFIRTLSKGGAGAHLLERAIQAIAQIVDSPGGKLWLRTETGSYEPASRWEMPDLNIGRIASDSSLVVFLERWQWVIDFKEYDEDPELYKDLDLPQQLLDVPRGWLIVPLMQDVQLLGFIFLLQSPIQVKFNWEDRDLLKTAGRQAAAHIAQLMATQALVEAREFEAFSKLSAFVMHDLKNLVAQLTLVSSNAVRHKHDPHFMEDAIGTIEHSVMKMNHLLKQLRTSDHRIVDNSPVDLVKLLQDIVDTRTCSKPAPKLECTDQGLLVSANRNRLLAVIEHIVQNAQEATLGISGCKNLKDSTATKSVEGDVRMRLYQDKDWAVIEISDNGSGMTPDFVQHRLFRPFDSTKGDSGMGVGAYQCREYIQSLGGEVGIQSQLNQGTVFSIRLRKG